MTASLALLAIAAWCVGIVLGQQPQHPPPLLQLAHAAKRERPAALDPRRKATRLDAPGPLVLIAYLSLPAHVSRRAQIRTAHAAYGKLTPSWHSRLLQLFVVSSHDPGFSSHDPGFAESEFQAELGARGACVNIKITVWNRYI
ncbi:hypothetical protein T492DRAFT_1005772 [Pavlovales sp. CCMP2436]|nr:hypothetical protein T492DRAFT_1005772 [Pavlovales sp. CCMP2436]